MPRRPAHGRGVATQSASGNFYFAERLFEID
jgi:hypothetical protein